MPQMWLMCLASAVVLVSLTPPHVEAIFGFSKRNEDDLYAVLGVPRHASQEAIKKAFRQRARSVHPDLKESAEDKEQAKDEMARVLRAYDILSDEVKKDTYDRFGVVAGENGVPNNAGGSGGPGGGGYPGGFPGGGNPWGNFFQHGQRAAEPIKSKTTSLASVMEYESLRMRTTREPMIALLQAYHDACFECRLVSTAWENLANSGFAYGAVAMHRVAMDNRDGSDVGMAILAEAGVSYGPAPVVFAVVRGDVYPLSSLPGVLFRERQGFIQPMLFDFVASFFAEATVATTPVIATTKALEETVHSRLALRESGSATFAILMVSDQVDLGLCLSLAARHPHMSVVVVQHTVLTSLLLHVCRMPDASTGAKHMLVLLPTASQTLRGTGKGGAAGRGGAPSAAWCPFLRVAVSHSAFSPSRAMQFVSKHNQVTIRAAAALPHNGASGGSERTLELLDSTTYWNACADRCVVLLMAQCQQPQQAATGRSGGADLGGMLKEYINRGSTVATAVHASDLLEDLSPFNALFVCLDAEPALAALLLASIARRKHGAGSASTVAQLDGGFLVLQSTTLNDVRKQQVLFIPPNAGSASGLFVNLQGLLADIMEGAEASYRAFLLPLVDGGDDTGIIPDVLLSHRLPLSWWRQLQWKLAALVDAASGLFTLLPLIAIWYAFRWCSAPRKPTEARAPPPPPHARHRGHANATSSGGDTSKQRENAASDGGAGRSPLYHVPYLSSADINAAQDGKGFLILIFHNRVDCLPGPLPMSLTGDVRFSVRVVEDHHKKWWRWLDDALVATGRRTSAHDAGPHFMAIRRGRMLAHLKPAHTTVAIWASELLDGSCVPSVPLPQ